MHQTTIFWLKIYSRKIIKKSINPKISFTFPNTNTVNGPKVFISVVFKIGLTAPVWLKSCKYENGVLSTFRCPGT